MQTGVVTISQMSSQYQVSFRALRFYESLGLIHPVRQGTIRYYTARDRVRLELILKGKRLGFSLREIEGMIAGDPDVDTKPAANVVDRLTPQQVKDKLTDLVRRREAIQAGIDELQDALAVADGARHREPIVRRA